MIFYGNKMAVVGFAFALQKHFGKDSQLTTITRLGKSEAYSVSIVTDTSSAAIVEREAQNFSLQLTNTSPVNIRGLSSRRK